jgi:hypothetical protein
VAGKYISLYRKIRDHGHYIHLSQNKMTVGKAGSAKMSIAGSSLLPKQ